MTDEPPAKHAKVVQPASAVSSAAAAAPSAADSSSTSSTAAASAITPSLSIAQRCDHFSLSIILSFSERFIDVLSAAQTCRSWRAVAVRRQSNCRASFKWLTKDRFFQMLQSPLRVHVAALWFEDAKGEDLLQLHARCPQLEELTIRVDGASILTLRDSAEGASTFNAHAWPSSMRSLDLGSHGFHTGVIGLRPLIDALPSSAIGLQSLHVHISGDKTLLDLAPLLQLPELTSLHVYPSGLSRPHMAVVRQLRNLTALDVNGYAWQREELLALLADGAHQLQRLQKINIIDSVTLDVELLQVLLTLPSLTELEPCGIQTHCFPLLRSFVKLRKLFISPRAVDNTAVVELLSSLRALSELTSLRVGGFVADAVVVNALMDGLGAAVPQLRELSFCYFNALPSLAAVSACTQLRALRLTNCERERGQSLDDILQLILSLRHLESVEVVRCRLPLTAAQCMQFAPPSALAPSLKTFDWQSRRRR
jgi:hypothetical protein